jgi:large subunit ribosomal protein L4
MAEITLKDRSGNDAGTVELDETVFGIEPNVSVMHQVVTAQLARRRMGTQSTKTRGEVRGGGAKPYRQKGTGRARQGSLRAPQYSGGGVALGPKPRSYAQRTPKKMIKLALRSALSDRASEGKVVVVDDWGFEAPRTHDARAALGALGLEGRVLLVVDRDDATTALSFRNLPDVQLIAPGELNAYDVLCNDWIVFTESNVPRPDANREAGEAKPSSEASEASTENERHGETVAESDQASSEAAEASTEDEQ